MHRRISNSCDIFLQNLVVLFLCTASSILSTTALQLSAIGSASSAIPVPKSENGTPIQIILDISFLDIEKIDGLAMEMSLNLQLHQYWKDARVHTDSSNTPGQTIWIPDTVVSNQRSQQSRNHLQRKISLRLDGYLEISEKIFATVKCQELSFHLYPFDYQNCAVNFQSSSYTLNQIQYKWKRNRYNLPRKSGLIPPFRIVGVVMEEFNITGNEDGTVSQLSLDIEFRRLWMIYTQRYYVPMTIFVATSVLSLWLVHPKISFIVNFVNIIFINIFLGIWELGSDIPKMHYKTAMDAYSIICILFIVLILILNVYILFYLKSDDDDGEDDDRRHHSIKSSNEQNTYNFLSKNESRDSDKPHPFLRTVHGRAATATSGSSSSNLESQSQSQQHTQTEMDTIHISEGCSRNHRSWIQIRAKLLDKIRRSGHTLFLFSFIGTVTLYWIALLGIYYS